MNLSRAQKLKYTTISSIISQIVSIICGFILPRMIIGAYGSEQNGLIHSICQFLSIITFLDLGVGTVVQSALYKPLAENDNEGISRIMVSAQKFFRTLARILAVYLVILTFVYPFLVNKSFDTWYASGMVAVLGYGMFAQYYFGIVNSLLITADQKGYVIFNLQIITVILNTVLSFLLIKFGVSLLLLKFIVSFIFLAKPFFLTFYVKKHYHVDYKIRLDSEPIQQKWNGVAMHVSSVVLDSTDLVVLTALSTLSNVSIYAVYFLVVSGVKTMFLSATNGIRALIGNLMANNEEERLRSVFSWFDWITHTGTTLIFGITGILIVPFVSVYTLGVTDADYIQPLFAGLLVAAHACHCLRLPYNNMILAGGHFRQTQSNYIIATVLNVVFSVVTVYFWGLIGVAIGTLLAMLYQTFWMAWYNSKHFIRWKLSAFFRQLTVDFITLVLMVTATYFLKLNKENFISWTVLAIEVSAMCFAISLGLNLIFYPDKLKQLYNMMKSKVKGVARI